MKKTLLQIAKYYYPVEGGIETVTKYMGEGLTTFEQVVVCFSQMVLPVSIRSMASKSTALRRP